MISKDEYKEIMKKGVAKLRNKEELKPDKVDRFVRQYVDLIAKRRKKWRTRMERTSVTHVEGVAWIKMLLCLFSFFELLYLWNS